MSLDYRQHKMQQPVEQLRLRSLIWPRNSLKPAVCMRDVKTGREPMRFWSLVLTACVSGPESARVMIMQSARAAPRGVSRNLPEGSS